MAMDADDDADGWKEATVGMTAANAATAFPLELLGISTARVI